ncbi:MAG: hypothetical protein GXP14_07380 [Gammaproteobacteria bacterium]|nr:hypothetical protein [Gammaproteobacteria bacterium]
MNLETNRKDFEQALDEMKVSLEAMDKCIDYEILEPVHAVINEYEEHYSAGIDEIISERHALQRKVHELEMFREKAFEARVSQI